MKKTRRSMKTRLGGIVNDTTYDDRAHPAVIEILEHARTTRQRICLRYGDPVTGRDWGDQRTCGSIGRSMGPVKIPLLIASSRSYGGAGVLTGNIVRIYQPRTMRTLYQHPKYHK